MLAAGVRVQDAYGLIKEVKRAKAGSGTTERAAKHTVLKNSNVSGDGKAIVYYGMIASEDERILLDQLTDEGADPWTAAKLLMDIQECNRDAEKMKVLVSSDMEESMARMVFESRVSDTKGDKINAVLDEGLTFYDFLDAHIQYSTINAKDLNAGQKALEFSRWVNSQDYTREQAETVRDEFTFFSMVPASADVYDKLVDGGLDPEDAYVVTEALGKLTPQPGEEDITDLQRWRASVDFSDDVEAQMTSLYVVMADAHFQKLEIAREFGVLPDSYVGLYETLPQYDADGNGRYKQSEIKAAIDSLGGDLSQEEKAALWQLATGSSSAKNNPYSTYIGQKVLTARESEK